jgi:hypothetical protein
MNRWQKTLCAARHAGWALVKVLSASRYARMDVAQMARYAATHVRWAVAHAPLANDGAKKGSVRTSAAMVAWKSASALADAKALAKLRAENPWLLNQAIKVGFNEWNGAKECGSALHRALGQGRHARDGDCEKSVELLLEWGEDPNALNSVGSTALAVAAGIDNTLNKWDLLALLTEKTDATLPNKWGNTALMALTDSSKAPETPAQIDIWRKIAMKSDLLHINAAGASALSIAAGKGRGALAKELLRLEPGLLEAAHSSSNAPWLLARESQQWEMLDEMASHPRGIACRKRVIEWVSEGRVRAEDVPKAWAVNEAQALQEAARAASAAGDAEDGAVCGPNEVKTETTDAGSESASANVARKGRAPRL